MKRPELYTKADVNARKEADKEAGAQPMRFICHDHKGLGGATTSLMSTAVRPVCV